MTETRDYSDDVDHLIGSLSDLARTLTEFAGAVPDTPEATRCAAEATHLAAEVTGHAEYWAGVRATLDDPELHWAEWAARWYKAGQ